MKNTDLKSPKFRFYGIITLVTLAFTYMFLVFPWWADDLWYMIPMRDYINGTDKSFPWEGLVSCWTDHYLHDNIRSANVLLTFFVLIPKWISSVLSGVMVWLIIYLAAKLAKLKYTDTGWLLILCTLLTVFLPWENFLIVTCYTLNYVWATALTLIAIYIFWSKWGYNYILLLLFGLLFGSWHEGFSGPTLVGFGTWMLLNRPKVTTKQWLICVGMVIGILWLASAPGIHSYVRPRNGFPRAFLLNCIPFAMFVASVLWVIASGNAKRIFDHKTISLCMMGLAGMGLIVIAPYLSGRIVCCGSLMSVILSVYFMKELTPQNAKLTLLKTATKILVAIFLIVHLSVSCYYTLILANQYNNVVEEYKKSETGTVFIPLTLIEDMPVICLRKPISRMYGGFFGQCVDFTYSKGDKRLRVIPIELKEYAAGDGMKIDGNLDLELYNNRFVGPVINSGGSDSVEVRLNTKFGGIGNIFFRTQFQGRDGENYYYYYPERLCLPQWLGIPIKEINAIKSDFQ